MLRNGIVDAALNESVLMVESANANNSTRVGFAVFPITRSRCYFEIPSASVRYVYRYHKRWDMFSAFSAFLYLKMACKFYALSELSVGGISRLVKRDAFRLALAVVKFYELSALFLYCYIDDHSLNGFKDCVSRLIITLVATRLMLQLWYVFTGVAG